MSACAIKQWGRGTPCVKESNTAAAKEMAAKLAQMQAERDKQDAAWHGGDVSTQSITPQDSHSQKGKSSQNGVEGRGR
jgi:hypothetical protein